MMGVVVEYFSYILNILKHVLGTYFRPKKWYFEFIKHYTVKLVSHLGHFNFVELFKLIKL